MKPYINRYVIYGKGDYKSKLWFIQDNMYDFLCSSEIYKTKKEAIKRCNKLNKELKEVGE